VKIFARPALYLVLFYSLTYCLHAQDLSIKFSVGAFVPTGSITSDITYSGVDPLYGDFNAENKQVFNLGTDMVDIGAEAVLGSRDWVLSGKYAFSVLGNSGNFQETDTYSDPNTGNISSTGLNTQGQILDVDLERKLFVLGSGNFLQVNAQAGYERQLWGTFDINNLTGSITIDGLNQAIPENSGTSLMTYEIAFDTYSGGLDFDFDLGSPLSAKVAALVGYADYDEVLMNYITGELGRGTGTGISGDIDASLSCDLGSGCGIGLFGHYKNLSATGDQTQTFYSGSAANKASEKIATNQLSGGLELAYAFSTGPANPSSSPTPEIKPSSAPPAAPSPQAPTAPATPSTPSALTIYTPSSYSGDSSDPNFELIKYCYDRGYGDFKRGDFADAEAELNRAKAIEPDNTLVNNLLNKVKQSDPEGAMEAAKTKLQNGDTDGALNDLADILAVHPNYKPALDLKNQILYGGKPMEVATPSAPENQ
jgi:tetratricopeptide (TPR) repeat protein